MRGTVVRGRSTGRLVHDRRSLARGVLLLSDSNRRADILDVFEHEHRILLRVLELLEQQQRFFVVAQAAFDAVSCKTCQLNRGGGTRRRTHPDCHSI